MFRRDGTKHVSVHWFRHGLRLHDNPALLKAVKKSSTFYAVFIFDGESAGTRNIGYNRMRFLLESLSDLDQQLREVGGRLHLFQGDPVTVFTRLWQELCITRITFEQDCEPIWQARDDAVRAACREMGVDLVEEVSHTLWNPKTIIETNGGIPPLTYQMFMHTVSVIGLPPRPVKDVDFSHTKFGVIPPYLAEELKALERVPAPEYFGQERGELGLEAGDDSSAPWHGVWRGGERNALSHLSARAAVEREAFSQGVFLTNQTRPDLLSPPTSQSAALRHGCLSIRKFYWTLHDLFSTMHPSIEQTSQAITGQLIWREYFYTMSVNNDRYAEMARNPICLKVNWLPTSDPRYQPRLNAWKEGRTGYPFIDAIMRQLKREGWVHHIARNAVACFLTRGDLWLSWEEGVNHFLHYLLDADWSVCAGNWMWVSSSAFEQLLDCSLCMCPVNFGRRFDPHGQYVKRYVPEVKDLPVEYIFEPWMAPLKVQQKAGCVVGKDYPERIVDHKTESSINRRKMEEIRRQLVSSVPHCCPSSTEEVRQFMWLQDFQGEHICVS